MNKMSLLLLLTTASLIQASDKGMREIPTPKGHVGRSFVVGAGSELGAIMQSMNDREEQDLLRQWLKMA